jgi:hypothetical protein
MIPRFLSIFHVVCLAEEIITAHFIAWLIDMALDFLPGTLVRD